MKKPSRQTDSRSVPQSIFTPSSIGIADRDLRVEIFALCDSAVEQHGRLSLLSTYEVVHATQFPFILPQTTAALRVRFWPSESRDHVFSLRITDPDGQPIGEPAEIQAALHSLSPERSAAYNLVVRLPERHIEEPGEYSVDFYLNGKLEARLPVAILEAPAALTHG